MNISDSTLVVCGKFSKELNLVKNCFDESDEIKFLTKISCNTAVLFSVVNGFHANKKHRAITTASTGTEI